VWRSWRVKHYPSSRPQMEGAGRRHFVTTYYYLHRPGFDGGPVGRGLGPGLQEDQRLFAVPDLGDLPHRPRVGEAATGFDRPSQAEPSSRALDRRLMPNTPGRFSTRWSSAEVVR
jgi:hypothetical protein